VSLGIPILSREPTKALKVVEPVTEMFISDPKMTPSLFLRLALSPEPVDFADNKSKKNCDTVRKLPMIVVDIAEKASKDTVFDTSVRGCHRDLMPPHNECITPAETVDAAKR